MRSFLLIFTALAVFSGVSCHRAAPAPAVAEVISPETPVAGSIGIQVPAALPTGEITRFAPLDGNERFAYSLWNRLVDSRPHAVFFMELYAVRENNIEDRRLLFTWEDMDAGLSVQFSSDFRTVFFVSWGEDAYSGWLFLYMADGATGEVRRLPTRVLSSWRVTKDGRFVAFLDTWQRSDTGERIPRHNKEQANIFVFDVEAETTTQLVWRINRPIDGGWRLLRFDNVFNIHGTFERGTVAAVAELNPATMELKSLWDSPVGGPPGNLLGLGEWGMTEWGFEGWLDEDGGFGQDDVVLQWQNPNVSLQR